jgi:magnesium-protoporphyrin O-methyltransferase
LSHDVPLARLCHAGGVPCSCCAGESLDIFGERGARRALRRYLRKGLGGSDAPQIAEWAAEGGLDGMTVMEVGGGIGQIQAELVRRGAAHGTVVEVVAGYEDAARELADATGIADRTSFVLADLVETPDAVESADIVVLRRVVCCTPVGPSVLGAAAGRARRTLLASYPRDRAGVRVVARLQNGVLALMRKRFRTFVHPPSDLERAAAAHGLRLARVDRGFVWETAQFDAAS